MTIAVQAVALDKPILITGGTGSFGKTMLNALLSSNASEVRVFSRDEEKQDALRNDLRDPRVRFFIGDVRDRDSVDRAMHGVGSVFHAAALKQVPSCEFFPLEAMRTNVLGSENVIRSVPSLRRGSLCAWLPVEHCAWRRKQLLVKAMN